MRLCSAELFTTSSGPSSNPLDESTEPIDDDGLRLSQFLWSSSLISSLKLDLSVTEGSIAILPLTVAPSLLQKQRTSISNEADG